MINGNYRIRYLPLFYDDMHSVVYYVVIDDQENGRVMEVRRLLYRHRGWERHV